jgi:N-acetylmuramoyl-L-alanine amidase
MIDFMPDSSVVADVAPSVNFGERRDGAAPDMIVLHYTGMPDTDAALRRLTSEGTEVSTHYLIHEDGRITQCVPESLRAWHAGVSSWAGDTDINSCSIGIEIANSGHDWGYPDFPLRQLAAVIALCKGIIVRRNIPQHRVLAHSDVSPGRKKDPGEKFPWSLLASSKVGHWVAPAPIVRGDILAPGASGTRVSELQRALTGYGYGLTVNGEYDAQTFDTVAAFQRHFRPERVDGLADVSTIETLRLLTESRDKLPQTPLRTI